MTDTPYAIARREKKAYMKIVVNTRFAEPAGVRWELEVGTLDADQVKGVIEHVLAMLVTSEQ